MGAPLQAHIITHKLTTADKTIPSATSDVALPHSLPLSKMAIPAFNNHSERNTEVSAARQPNATLNRLLLQTPGEILTFI